MFKLQAFHSQAVRLINMINMQNSPGLAYPFPSQAHLWFSCQSLPAFWLSLTLEKKRKGNEFWVQNVQLLKMQKHLLDVF